MYSDFCIHVYNNQKCIGIYLKDLQIKKVREKMPNLMLKKVITYQKN